MNRYDLEGRVALITGGGRGIGAATAVRLRASGARVATLDLTTSTEAPAELALTGDVTSRDDLDAAVAAVVERFGSLDVLVCAAGVFVDATATAEVTDEQWERVLSVNASGTFYAMRAVTPGMVERAYGRIVTVASIAGKEGVTRGDAYAASKAAVISVTRTVGRDLAGTGVIANCVVPALIETDMAGNLSAEQYAFAVSRIPMGRLGRPEEVAAMITFLASEEVSFSTGACFDLTGGRANY